MTREGSDAFGTFVLMTDPCDICRKERVLSLQYHEVPELPAGIKLKDTIHKTHPKAIGITCGCYAKFHRQVAHIQTSMKARQ